MPRTMDSPSAPPLPPPELSSPQPLSARVARATGPISWRTGVSRVNSPFRVVRMSFDHSQFWIALRRIASIGPGSIVRISAWFMVAPIRTVPDRA